MPPIVIDLRKTEDHRDVVHRAVQTLAEGGLVVFPTETVYGIGASARSADGVEKLFEIKGRSHEAPFALAIKSAEEALDYVPQLGQMAERLARRCWPGPVTLVVDCGEGHGLVNQLPESVRRAIAPGGTIGLRVPAQPVVLDVLRMLAGPIALTSANRSGEPAAVTAEQAAENLGDQVDLILDDGRSRYGQASTVVRATGHDYSCIREGVVGRSALDRLSSMMVLLVCTGNTCRSPMAEVIMRQLIAEKLGHPESELDQHGMIVLSAGIAAVQGCGPSHEAVVVMKEKGLDLRKHESQPLTEKLVRHADVILTMTEGHRHAILRRWPESSTRIHTLRADGKDIQDPIGGSANVYRECAEEVQTALQQRVDELEF
ncbi:MAG: threonylcarbamoyl-AMP synthase [Planctomycetes bacterium]|nr:threonylcarbamoyl-AMP synthase [Planctomycetota bacterium]